MYRYGKEAAKTFTWNNVGLKAMKFTDWKNWDNIAMSPIAMSPQVREILRYGLILQGRVELWCDAVGARIIDYANVVKMPAPNAEDGAQLTAVTGNISRN